MNIFHKLFLLLYKQLRAEKKERFNRRVSLGDLLTDRTENAQFLGFGEGSSCYDNVLVLGNVTVGKNTWIGPNVILDGTGGLEIGDHCSISAGVQIYTHNTVKQTCSGGVHPIEYAPVKIGDRVYIGPNSIIQMGVTIESETIIGAMSFVNKKIPFGMKCHGIPVQISSERKKD